MASAELSRRVGKVVGYPPLCDLSDQQRREFHLALLEADSFEDLPGKWQAAVLEAEQNRPKLRVVSGDWRQRDGGRGAARDCSCQAKGRVSSSFGGESVGAAARKRVLRAGLDSR
jgi:hypothetical protein